MSWRSVSADIMIMRAPTCSRSSVRLISLSFFFSSTAMNTGHQEARNELARTWPPQHIDSRPSDSLQNRLARFSGLVPQRDHIGQRRAAQELQRNTKVSGWNQAYHDQ